MKALLLGSHLHVVHHGLYVSAPVLSSASFFCIREVKINLKQMEVELEEVGALQGTYSALI